MDRKISLFRHAGASETSDSIYLSANMILVKHKYFSVYIMTNYTNTVLYVGITNNLVRRIYEHKEKLEEGFTQKYNINKLVYFEVFENAEAAIKREKAIKNLVRRKKIALIEKDNPEWKDLFGSIV